MFYSNKYLLLTHIKALDNVLVELDTRFDLYDYKNMDHINEIEDDMDHFTDICNMKLVLSETLEVHESPKYFKIPELKECVAWILGREDRSIEHRSIFISVSNLVDVLYDQQVRGVIFD